MNKKNDFFHRLDFIEEIRLLSALKDPNVTKVLGVSSEEDPCSVILEFLELGDLCQFLRQKDTTHPAYMEKLRYVRPTFIMKGKEEFIKKLG